MHLFCALIVYPSSIMKLRPYKKKWGNDIKTMIKGNTFKSNPLGNCLWSPTSMGIYTMIKLKMYQSIQMDNLIHGISLHAAHEWDHFLDHSSLLPLPCSKESFECLLKTQQVHHPPPFLVHSPVSLLCAPVGCKHLDTLLVKTCQGVGCCFAGIISTTMLLW